MENKIWSSSDIEFTDLIRSSSHIKEVLFKVGLTTSGNSWGYQQVKLRMEALGLTYGDFKGRSPLKLVLEDTKIPYDKLFTETRKHSRSIVRNRIIHDNLLEHKCAICGISEWNGKALSLDLDHINGVNYDNRLENLRFLCPNCHSQTTTYGSRNRQLNESKYDITNELRSLVISSYEELHNINRVSKVLNIRINVVKIILSESGLSRSNQRFVIRYDKDMNEINRFGSINSAAQFLIDNNYLRTRLVKTARNSFLRNYDRYWCDSYWKLMDA